MTCRFDWPPQARASLRNIDRETAPRILHALTRFARGESADIAPLHGPLAGWRGFLRPIGPGHYRVLEVDKRGQAYR
jgi:hypothetical protein